MQPNNLRNKIIYANNQNDPSMTRLYEKLEWFDLSVCCRAIEIMQTARELSVQVPLKMQLLS